MLEKGFRPDLLAELERRANPERSRQFSPDEFERGLQRLQSLAASLLLQEPFRYRPDLRISIVGTNGKGTVAFALEYLFRKALHQNHEATAVTGLYTSPHLLHFTERIRLDGTPVELAELEELFSYLCGLPLAEEEQKVLASLTYFELLTLLGLLLFQKRRIPVQIYEAGLGGRLDATRIAEADAIILTSIGLDHTALLGSTRKRIFEEKMGIISSKTRFLFLPDSRFKSMIPANEGLQVFVFEKGRGSDYLKDGAAYAGFIFDSLRRITGYADVGTVSIPSPPGRLEKRKTHQKTWIFDNAHNVSAIYTLLKGLKDLSFRNTAVVLALSRDRRPAPVFRLIGRFGFSRLIFVTGPGLRSVEIDSIRRWSNIDQVTVASLDDAGPAKDTAKAIVQNIEERCVLFMGSHRLYDIFDRETSRRSGEQ